MAAPVALVTGASSGIGLQLTNLLLKRNWRVVMADLVPPASEALLAQKDSVLFIRTNALQHSELEAAFREGFKWGGNRLDFVAANAGMFDKQSIYEQADPAAEKPIDVTCINLNLLSSVQALWIFSNYASRNPTPGGKFVLTSSSVALYGQPAIPLYAASKLAVAGLTWSCGEKFLKEQNITVNCVAPAFVKTGMAPGGMLETWPKEHTTPMETMMNAYSQVLDSDTLTGVVLEASMDEVYHRQPLSYANDSQRWIREESLHFLETYAYDKPAK